MNFMHPIEELLDYAAPTLQRFGAEHLLTILRRHLLPA
jgi:hypothetical protein